MLINYIHSAMRLAEYEILEDRQYYGKIPGFDGVWAQAQNLEACREESQSALEDWLILGLRMGHKLPVVADGLTIEILEDAELLTANGLEKP